MSRYPYHPVRPTRPRPGRVPRQRSAPPPRSTGGKSTTGCLIVAAPALVVGVSLALTPAYLYGIPRLIAPALVLTMFGLYLAVSLMLPGHHKPAARGKAPAAVTTPTTAGAGG